MKRSNQSFLFRLVISLLEIGSHFDGYRNVCGLGPKTLFIYPPKGHQFDAGLMEVNKYPVIVTFFHLVQIVLFMAVDILIRKLIHESWQ